MCDAPAGAQTSGRSLCERLPPRSGAFPSWRGAQRYIVPPGNKGRDVARPQHAGGPTLRVGPMATPEHVSALDAERRGVAWRAQRRMPAPGRQVGTSQSGARHGTQQIRTRKRRSLASPLRRSGARSLEGPEFECSRDSSRRLAAIVALARTVAEMTWCASLRVAPGGTGRSIEHDPWSVTHLRAPAAKRTPLTRRREHTARRSHLGAARHAASSCHSALSQDDRGSTRRVGPESALEHLAAVMQNARGAQQRATSRVGPQGRWHGVPKEAAADSPPWLRLVGERWRCQVAVGEFTPALCTAPAARSLPASADKG